MPRFIWALMLTLAVGCASTSNIKDSPATETLFVYGVLKAIEQAQEPVEKARRIRAIARDIQALAASESVRGAVLERLIQEAVAERNLSPADLYLVSQVVPLTELYAGEDGVITGERKEALLLFLDKLIGATALY